MIIVFSFHILFCSPFALRVSLELQLCFLYCWLSFYVEEEVYLDIELMANVLLPFQFWFRTIISSIFTSLISCEWFLKHFHLFFLIITRDNNPAWSHLFLLFSAVSLLLMKSISNPYCIRIQNCKYYVVEFIDSLSY